MRKGSGYTWGRAPLNGSKSSVLGKTWARTMQFIAFSVRWQYLYILCLAQCLACRRHTEYFSLHFCRTLKDDSLERLYEKHIVQRKGHLISSSKIKCLRFGSVVLLVLYLK